MDSRPFHYYVRHSLTYGKLNSCESSYGRERYRLDPVRRPDAFFLRPSSNASSPSLIKRT